MTPEEIRAQRAAEEQARIREQQLAVMGGGRPNDDDGWMRAGVAGLINGGIGYNFGDEITRARGDDDSYFTDAYEEDPLAYGVGSLIGTTLSPWTLAGRIPLALRHHGLREALQAVDARKLQDSLANLTRRDAARGGGLMDALRGRNRREYQANVGGDSDAALASLGARRSDSQMSDAALLQATVDRRAGTQALADDLSVLHGALAGFGGVTPGEMDIEDRLMQAGLGGALGFAATRSAADVNDLARGPIPFLTRASDRQVVDLADVPVYRGLINRMTNREEAIPADSLTGLMRRMAGSEEASYRSALGIDDASRLSSRGRPAVRYGRGASVRDDLGEQDPNVAPINDPLSLTRGLIARATTSADAPPVLNRLRDQTDVQAAFEAAMGARPRPNAPQLQGQAATMPDFMREDFADALLRDAPGRAYLRELVLGQRNWQRGQPLRDAERAELRQLVLSRLEGEGRRVLEAQDAGAARRVLALMEDPDIKAMFGDRGLAMEFGRMLPPTQQMRSTLQRLQQLAGRDLSSGSTLQSLERPDDAARQFAMMLDPNSGVSGGASLSRRLTQAILDPTFLNTPQRRWAVDPNDRLRDGELALRRERGVIPYGRRATAGPVTEVAGAALAGLGDRVLHYNLLNEDDR